MKKLSQFNLVKKWKYPIITREWNVIREKFENNSWRETTIKENEGVSVTDSRWNLKEVTYNENWKKEFFKKHNWEFWERIYNNKWKEISFKDSSWYWENMNYNEKWLCYSYENSNWEYWTKKYDNNGNEVYFETSEWYWRKIKYNDFSEEIWFNDSKWNWREKIEEWFLAYDSFDNKYKLNWIEYVLKN